MYMYGVRLSMVILALVLGGGYHAAPAATADEDKPAEPPPAGYLGREYVDSRGCAFLRIRIGNESGWTPLRGPDRTPVCNRMPTFPGRDPANLPAGDVTDASSSRAAEAATPDARQPVRTVGAVPAAARAVATPRRHQGRQRAAVDTRYRLPRGYVRVWKDGRLNPLRGPRAAWGDAQMDRIWTRTVPRRLRSGAVARRLATEYAGQKGLLRQSAAVRQQLPANRRANILVAGYRSPESATATVARLKALGIPARVTMRRQRGRTVHVVTVGPYRSAARAERALKALHRAGYRHAALRG